MNELFIEFAVMHFIFVISPGTSFIFLLSNGLKFGMNKAFYSLLGTTIGYGIIAILTVVGLVEILYEFPTLHHFIKYVGSLYLLFKAWQIWQNAGKINESIFHSDYNVKNSKKILIISGFKVSMTNPQIGINMIALLSCFTGYSMTCMERFLIITWMIVGYFIYFYVMLKIFTNNYILSIVTPKMKIIERILSVILAILAIKIIL